MELHREEGPNPRTKYVKGQDAISEWKYIDETGNVSTKNVNSKEKFRQKPYSQDNNNDLRSGSSRFKTMDTRLVQKHGVPVHLQAYIANKFVGKSQRLVTVACASAEEHDFVCCWFRQLQRLLVSTSLKDLPRFLVEYGDARKLEISCDLPFTSPTL